MFEMLQVVLGGFFVLVDFFRYFIFALLELCMYQCMILILVYEN